MNSRPRKGRRRWARQRTLLPVASGHAWKSQIGWKGESPPEKDEAANERGPKILNPNSVSASNRPCQTQKCLVETKFAQWCHRKRANRRRP
jgi:hypothetical protein